MTLGPVVRRGQPRHITGVLTTAVDEQNRGNEGQQNQQDEEKQSPRFNVGEGGPPKNPEEGEIEENAVPAGDGGEACTGGALLKEDGNFLFFDQAQVHAASDANLSVGSVTVEKELARIGAPAVATCWHGGPPLSPNGQGLFNHPIPRLEIDG